MRSSPMMVKANFLFLLTLLVLGGGDVVASSSSVSAFHGVHSSVRRRVKSSMPSPFTKTTPSSQRSEIMKIYKSKSDNDDDDDDDTSKSRSWFKPWRWFARRQRRKRQPKISPTIESLLYAFKEAQDLGIIKVNDNDSDSINTVDVNGTFPTQMAPETIKQIIAAVPSDRPLVIENTFVGNTYSSTKQNGLELLPKVKFRNDMAGSFHNNNNAAAKYGNVSRQNGVADFQGALRNNNNAVSESGNVSRENGVFAPSFGAYEYEDDDEDNSVEDGNLEEDDDSNDTGPMSNKGRMISRSREEGGKSKNQQEQGQESETPSRQDDGEFFSLFGGKQSNTNNSSRLKDSQVDDHEISNVVTAYMRGSLNNNASWYEAFNYDGTNPPIVIRNTYIGNKYKSATHNGVNLGVDVDFKNDMGDAFYENNNAVAYEGNVRRQNGVADFTDALRKNNNAVSGSGDVERLNGVDVASLPLLLPLLDFNITLPNRSNATTLFDAALGDIFRLYKRKIQKKKAQKEEINSAVVNYYKPKIESKRNGKRKKWKKWYKVSKLL